MKLLGPVILEIWFFLLIAFLLGMFVQWFFCCRNKDDKTTTGSGSVSTPPEAVAVASSTVVESVDANTSDIESEADIVDKTSMEFAPLRYDSEPESKDELKRIKGIGAVFEKTLNGLGVYTFEQIASWTPDNVAWVEQSLSFPGRIGREDWINQAKILAEGGTTEFAKKVDKGDVEY